jgi:hypothetical protein
VALASRANAVLARSFGVCIHPESVTAPLGSSTKSCSSRSGIFESRSQVDASVVAGARTHALAWQRPSAWQGDS